MTRVGQWALVPAVLAFAASVGAAGRDAPLVEAVKNGDATSVRALLKQRVDVNATEPDGTTALHWAVKQDDLALVTSLLKSGANAKATNRYGVPPLWLACINGNAAIVEQLLKAGASANSALPEGETMLMTAARTGKVDAIKTLLASGADIHARDSYVGQTALMFAAAENNAAAIRLLVEAGADIHARSGDEASGRAIVAANNAIAKVEPFGTRGYGGGTAATARLTPLLVAVRNGRIEAAKTLLELGANVNDASVDGTSAVVLAIINAHFELASVLLDKGANPNAAAQGFTALHQLARSRGLNMGQNPHPVPTGHISTMDLAKKLIERGADVNARMTKEIKDGYRARLNRVGATPFLLAAKNVDVELMRFLLAQGADPNIITIDGVTPLIAAAGGYMFNPGEDAGTGPGTEAQAQEAVKMLLDLGASVTVADKNGETPLHGVAYRGDNTIAQWLIDRGARLDAKNAMGWIPLRIADGITYTGFFKQQRQTAALFRQAMKARGMAVEEKGIDNTDGRYTEPKR
jgi:ankyrin repeat protein